MNTIGLDIGTTSLCGVCVDAATGEVLWVPGYRIAQSVAVESPTAPSWLFTLTS